MGFNIGSLIGTVAPWIATALGGPAVGAGVKAVASALGLGDDATESDVQEALKNATPEQLLLLKKADQEFAVRMKELGINEVRDLEKLAVDDRASARAREVATKDVTTKILAYSVVGAFIAVVGTILLGVARVESVLAGTLVGYLSAKAEQVIAYYFGSSSGSTRKTEILAKAEPVKDL
jgi:hypothetical protein